MTTISQGKARRYLYLLSIPILLVLSLYALRRTSHAGSLPSTIDSKLPPSIIGEPAGYDPKAKPAPLYLPEAAPPPAVSDNFPDITTASLPAVPAWNKPPSKHSKHATPLFIGFTRNWRLLQQTVVSYIVAGWPPGDIYVVENTGTMQSNKHGQLSLQNPFYLDYHRLTKVLGVNVLTTPTLFTFAQLQNYYIWTSLEKGWEHYWWAHMDTIAVSDEEWLPAAPKDGKKGKNDGYKSLYARAIDVLEETMDPSFGTLATIWFSYDHLALVRTSTFAAVGGWDTMIPFYHTDCDMHERLWMNDYIIESREVGKIWDVADSLDDLGQLFLRGDGSSNSKTAPSRNSAQYKDLLRSLDTLQASKHENKDGRNTWQASQKGGQGEPFYRDSDGFERALQMTISFGREVFAAKWGRGECNIREVGLVEGDEWRLVDKWENPEVQRQYWKEKERKEKSS